MRILCITFMLAFGSLLQTSISVFSRLYVKVPGIDLSENIKKTTISEAVDGKVNCAILCTKVATCTAFVHRSNKECIHVNERPTLLNSSVSSGDEFMVIDAYTGPIVGLTKGRKISFSHGEGNADIGSPKAANDGIYHLNVYVEPYCTHYIIDKVRPWLKIDMEAESTVVYGKILPRHDSFASQARNLSVHVGDISDPLRLTENHLCYHYPGILPLATIHEFQCTEPVRGRYVYLSTTYHEYDLVVCEFEVFGKY